MISSPRAAPKTHPQRDDTAINRIHGTTLLTLVAPLMCNNAHAAAQQHLNATCTAKRHFPDHNRAH
ncbi:hypothetical protein THS27_16270 [Thalassospira sp. MCCC 1A01428]|nr:hypothetical protein THS27_16270 [Thalassospira sp. MCCC 1A01428]